MFMPCFKTQLDCLLCCIFVVVFFIFIETTTAAFFLHSEIKGFCSKTVNRVASFWSGNKIPIRIMGAKILS